MAVPLYTLMTWSVPFFEPKSDWDSGFSPKITVLMFRLSNAVVYICRVPATYPTVGPAPPPVPDTHRHPPNGRR